MTQLSKPLTVIICTYNVKEKVLENIRSVLAQKTSVPYELLLVDSGSTDGTLDAVREEFPDIHIHDCKANVGCAIARNVGLSRFPEGDVLLLDSDLVLEGNAIEEFHKHLGDNVGQICGHLYSVDDSFQCTAFRKPHLISLAARLFYFSSWLPKSWQEKYSNEDLKNEFNPFWTSGGFTWVTREAINKVGPRDEDFFVYGEDVEHAHRMSAAGMKIIYTPKARALHYGSSSTRQDIARCREDVYRGLLLYWKKRQNFKYPIAYLLIISRLFIISTFLFLIPHPKRWAAAGSHAKVLFKILCGKI